MSIIFPEVATSESVIFLDLWVKCRNFHRATAFLFPDEEPEILGQLGGLIGRGCFETVHHLCRHGIQMAVKIPRGDGPTPNENPRILMEECHRASRLHHDNIVKTAGSCGSATLWELATGLPWNLGLVALLPLQRCKVAAQISAALHYLIRHSHTAWDVHQEDILIDLCTSRVTFLDVFMRPNELSGCLHTLPPELRPGGLRRLQAIEQLGNSIAARVNGFVAALLFANLLLPHLSLQEAECEQSEQPYWISALMRWVPTLARQTPLAGAFMAATQEIMGR